MAGRRFLVPEVVQTSGMDCGPAALAALAAGFGVRAGYDRLREACQTDVDGTSIDALEDIARALGLDATQVLVPPDHVATNELPAIALVRSPEGIFHFVVAWRRVGRWVQLMDPTVGRRWTTAPRLRQDLVIHEMDVSAEAVTGLAGSAPFGALLAGRLRALGASEDRARALVSEAVEAGADAVYALDAATRTAARAGAPHSVVPDLAALAHADPSALPAGCWFACPADGDQVRLRGAVLLTAVGLLPDDERVDVAALPTALREAGSEPTPSPLRDVAAMAGGPGRLVAGLALAVVLGVGGALLGIVGRRALDGGSIGPLGAIASALLALELGATAMALAAGRRVEASFRRSLYDRVPRLPDRYFRSRPTSDSAERAHRVHGVHELPGLGMLAARTAAELVAVAAALVVVRSDLVVVAIAAVVAAVAVPLLAAPLQQERDLRVRTHGGALARSWLDAVAGRVPLRAHRAEAVLEHDNERLLEEWSTAAGRARRLAIGVEAVQAAVGVAFAVALVARADASGARGATVLLVAFWALRVVALGQTLAGVLRTWPLQRAITMRFLEPLSAPVDGPDPPARTSVAAPAADGVAVDIDGVTVDASGHLILRDCSVSLAPGEHVAVVGASGSGKTTLVGLLLGWTRPRHGSLRVDGAELDHEGRAVLRGATAWIAPDVSLWRGSVAENVTYGSPDAPEADRDAAAEAAELTSVLATLPDGWAAPLGDAGRRLSGGEGQRVRVARALLRQGVRLAVLDEAFRGMPRDQRTRLLERCRRRWARATVVHVTHDVTDALDFARVLVVDEGQIVEDGDPQELAAAPGTRFAALLDADRARTGALLGDGWRGLDLVAGRLMDADGSPGRAFREAPGPALGGPVAPPSPASPEQLVALRAAIPRWWPTGASIPAGADLSAAATALGLRAEQLPATRAWLAETLEHARRAVVAHADGGATAVRRGRADAALLADLAAGPAPTIAPLPGLDPGAVAALQAAEAADQEVPGVWRVRPDPAVALGAAARWAGLPARLAGYAIAHAVEIVAYVVAFGVLGSDALDGGVTGGTVAAFGLALALAVPARAVAVGLGQRVAVDAGRILKRRLLRGALCLPSDEARDEGVGRVMGRIVEAEAVEDQAVSGALGSVIAVVELVVAAAVLRAGVHGGLAVTGLVVWAALAAVALRGLVGRRRAWAAARLEVALDLVEKLLGHRTRLVQQPPERWADGEAERVDAAQRASRRVDRLHALLSAGLAPGWLALGASFLALAGPDDQTALATSLGGLLLAASGLERLGRGSADLAGAIAAYDACRPLSQAAGPLPLRPPTRPGADAAVRVAGVVVRHPGRPDPILDGVSVAIAARDRVVLRGPSGAGKSTLAAVLAGLRATDAGQVERSGDVVLAAQFHENHVLLGPMGFNLLLGRRWPYEDADLRAAGEVCTALGLDRVLSRMPSGLEQIVGETGWQLSHGETHLLNVARALLQGGDVVVLDESLGALDPATAGVALRVLGAAAPAVVVIAQD